jgi:hypothetical protein
MKKLITAPILLVFALGILCIPLASASTGTLFIIGDGSTDLANAGTWQCGYVIEGSPGTHTYTLRITSTHNVGALTNVHVVALISDAAADGGLQKIVLSSSKTSSLTLNCPDSFTEDNGGALFAGIYGANGGPAALSDYYGFNNAYVIQSLTQAETDKTTTTGFPVTVEITFAPHATVDSKVYFLVYGTTANGDQVKAPFSGGTLFEAPEYLFGGLVATAACFGAFGVVKLKSKN